MKELGGAGISSCTTFALPKEGIEVVCLAKNGLFTDITVLDQCLEVKEATCKL